MSKSCRLPDYADYHFPFREGTLALLEGASLVAMIGYFFYRSWLACVCPFYEGEEKGAGEKAQAGAEPAV